MSGPALPAAASPLYLFGAGAFGIVVRLITYRTLVRAQTTGVADLATVIGAVGGGTVTTLVSPADGSGFAVHSICLLPCMAIYLVLSLALRGKHETPGRSCWATTDPLTDNCRDPAR